MRGKLHYISVDLETESWIYLFLFYATKTLDQTPVRLVHCFYCYPPSVVAAHWRASSWKRKRLGYSPGACCCNAF